MGLRLGFSDPWFMEKASRARNMVHDGIECVDDQLFATMCIFGLVSEPLGFCPNTTDNQRDEAKLAEAVSYYRMAADRLCPLVETLPDDDSRKMVAVNECLVLSGVSALCHTNAAFAQEVMPLERLRWVANTYDFDEHHAILQKYGSQMDWVLAV